MLYRRDTRDKTTVALEAVADDVQQLTRRMQTDMLDAATARRDAFISDCTTLDEVRDVAQTGVARVPWACARRLRRSSASPSDGLTVRCLQRDDGTLPDTDDDAGALAYVARAY